MQLANPTSLLWFLLAVPIVVFYMLKVRLPDVSVSTVMFWDQIFEEKRLRSMWRRLRHPISLLLQLLFLTLLVLALSQPFSPGALSEARRVVLVVDNSASMNATDVSPSRLDEARRQAIRLVRGLGAQEQMAVVSAGSVPRVVAGLTSHQPTLLGALRALPPSDGPTRVEQAITLAQRLLAGHRPGELVVLTDDGAAVAAGLKPSGNLRILKVGAPADNVAITQFQVRRQLHDIVGYQILIEVANFSSGDVECRLELRRDEALVDVVPLQLKPQQRRTSVLDHSTEEGGRLWAKLDVTDALECDNQAVALLPRREPQPVVLVTAGSLFLEEVLQSIPRVELTVTDTPPARMADDSILILDRQVPSAIPPGNVMVINPVGSCDLWNLGSRIEAPLVATQDSNSPLMRHVQLENVTMAEAMQLNLMTPHRTLAASLQDEPIYMLIERPTGPVLVLTANLEQGDLPLRTAFPILMTNAIVQFQGSRGEFREALPTGSFTEVNLSGRQTPARITTTEPEPSDPPQRPDDLVLRGPNGSERALPKDATVLTVGPLDRCGVWQVVPKQSKPPFRSAVYTELACNLVNAEESDLQGESSPPPTTMELAAVGGRPIWFYLAAAALVLTAVEWLLYQRRWIS